MGGGRQDGDPSHPPPLEMRIHVKNRRIWVKSTFSHVTWQVSWQVRIRLKVAICPRIPQRVVLARNLFSKIDAGIFYLPTAVSKSARLFPVSSESKNSAYIVKPPLYKLWGRGIPPQSASRQSRGNIFPRRVMISKNKASHSSTHWTVSSLLFFGRKYCCTQSAHNNVTRHANVTRYD